MAREERSSSRHRSIPKPSEDAVRNASMGSRFKGWIKPEYEDMVYKPTEGKNRIRILAWIDGLYFGMQVKEHKNVGPNKAAYLCMSSVINKKRDTLYDFLKPVIDEMDNRKEVSKQCAVCEDIAEKIKSGKYKGKDIKSLGLYPSARTIYLLVDRDNEDKGVQIWPAPYWKIDEELRKRLIDPEDGSVLNITDPEEGYDIYFEMEVEKTADGTFPKYTAVQIARKPSRLDPDFYDKIIDLREVVVIPTYKEIAEDYGDGEAAPEVSGRDKEYDKGFPAAGKKKKDDDDEDERRKDRKVQLPTADEIDDMKRDDLEDFAKKFKKIAKEMDDMSTKELRAALIEAVEEAQEEEGGKGKGKEKDKDDDGDKGGDGDSDDCFGKEYGKYRDCDSTCPDRKECKLKIKDKGGEEEEKPARRKRR